MLSYALGERLLARNKGSTIFYEAKVVDKTEEGYGIHYLKWSKRYDEFIGVEELEGRTKKFSEEALKQAKAELAAAKKLLKEKAKKRSTVGIKVHSELSGEKDEESRPVLTQKRVKKGEKADVVVNTDENSNVQAGEKELVKAEEKAPCKFEKESSLPANLKEILLQDAELVRNQSKVYTLPAKTTASTIISKYINDLTLHKQDNEKVELKYVGNRVFKAKDIIYNAEGIQELMDGFLAREYLYSSEAQQYRKAMEEHHFGSNDKFLPSHHYGLPHLVRVLNRFDFLNGEIRATAMHSVIADFVHFLDLNYQQYFAGEEDYQDLPTEKPLA